MAAMRRYCCHLDCPFSYGVTVMRSVLAPVVPTYVYCRKDPELTPFTSLASGLSTRVVELAAPVEHYDRILR